MKSTLITSVLVIFAFIGGIFSAGTPVPAAEFYLEQDGNDQPYAFMQTGDNGKITFANLPRGLYHIKVNLPRQSGKLLPRNANTGGRLQVGYHNDKKTYYMREEEGFFTVNFSKIKRLANKNITPVYNLQLEGRSKLVEIGKFEVTGNNGGFTLELKAHKPKKFTKLIDKVKDDLGMVTIRNAG